MKSEDLLRRTLMVDPLAFREYAESHGWRLSPEVDQTKLFLFTNREWNLRQLLIPIQEKNEDYGQAVLDAAYRLAELERRPVEDVIEDLLTPSSDVLRFRISSKDTEQGSIALTSAIGLMAGIKKALLSAACSVNHPKRHHPRMGWTEATRFIDSCHLGQTEPGSFVVKIYCPLQLEQEIVDRRMAESFERRAVQMFLESSYVLVRSIDADNIKSVYSNDERKIQISANLCEALLEIHYSNEEADIAITAQGASGYPHILQKELMMPIVFTPEHFPAILQIYERLRFPKRSFQAKFSGTVIGLSGTMRRRQPAGEVTLLIQHRENMIHVKTMLGIAEYELADKAHMTGKKIELHGILQLGKRTHRITDVSEFKIVQ
ncbi:MAG TPA: hypothetical protein VG733_04200 [Chthoniobacteraceae bacterium]|nr:hypothetical protein [Chthoniobacteraceae bacterium]